MLQEQVISIDSDPTKRPRILLVDDSNVVRDSLGLVLEHNGFAVVSASNVKDALHLIASQAFDVLLSDLHMPNAGDGLTVVSAMRHSNPEAVTLLFSGYPGMKEAATAILMQADEILVKPLAVDRLVETIRDRMNRVKTPARAIESVATILEQERGAIIKQWLERVASEPKITRIRLDDEKRGAHIPQLLTDMVWRLRNPLPLGTHALVSSSAAVHGLLREQQGYSAAMLVEESRMLQVTLFQTLQDNLHKVDFSLLLVGVMAIADEVDSQLAQSMTSYNAESRIGLAS